MESIGKIFSHVHQKCILGYKALMLCWSDGRTQFMLDFSLHGEMGKIEGKEQGLTSAQRKARYERQRDKDSHISKRKNEYFMGKGGKLLKMVKDAIQNKVSFDYLLVDSWFTCTELADFVCRCHKKFHLLGMARMGNTQYVTESWGKLSAIKRTLDYDTIGGLFEDMYLGVHELTVVEKIWAIIIEVVAVVAELIEADSEVLTLQVINSDKRLAALRAYAQTA